MPDVEVMIEEDDVGVRHVFLGGKRILIAR
jgi:hypothetical protein